MGPRSHSGVREVGLSSWAWVSMFRTGESLGMLFPVIPYESMIFQGLSSKSFSLQAYMNGSSFIPVSLKPKPKTLSSLDPKP